MEARSPCLVRRRVAQLSPQARIVANGVMIGSPLRLADEKGQVPGKSPNMCPGLHRTNMVGHDPEDQSGDRYDAGLPFSSGGCRPEDKPVWVWHKRGYNKGRMTLCGSEVPQDRWRGRTAGSGMWTRTRESASWSPCGDSAIPYG